MLVNKERDDSNMQCRERIRLITVTVVALVILAGLGSSSAIVVNKELKTTAYNSGNLLRLHVIANSNSLEDQKLKRRIRDKIIAQTEGLFKEVNSAKRAQEVVKKNLGYIKKVVESELDKMNSEYKVRLNLDNFHFPKRTYGNVTLPTGDYDALRVVLGEGKGENWWCVLFPPLCYIDAVNNESKKQKVADVEAEDIEIKVESKLLEYIESNQQLIKKKEKIKRLLRVSITNLNNLFANNVPND